MSRIRIVVVSALVAGALVIGVESFAQGRQGGGRGPGGRMGGAGIPVQALNLTEDQQKQIRAVRESHQEALRTAEGRVREARRALREAIRTVPVNESLVRSASRAAGDAETDAALAQARLYSDTWILLTPEQQGRLRSLNEQRPRRR
jgi:Spy/CpxP family protein refolding chaperone